MSDAKPYTPEEMIGRDSTGVEFVRGGLDAARVRATFVTIEAEREKWRSRALAAQKRIDELVADLDEANIVIERGAVELRKAQKRIEELEAQVARHPEQLRRVAEATTIDDARRLEGLFSVPLASAEFLEGVRRCVAMLRHGRTTTALDAISTGALNPTEMRGGLRVRKGAPVCGACKDDDSKREDCRACGATGLHDLADVR